MAQGVRCQGSSQGWREDRRGVGAVTSITIRIANFDDFNPRGDVKRPSWFRLDHGMIDDPDFYNFNDGEFRAWIYILSMASRKNDEGRVRVVFDHADRACRVTRKSLEGAIRKLEELQIVTVDVTDTSRERHADGTFTNATYVRTNERTDGIDPIQLQEIWNQNRGSLPEVKKLTGKRTLQAKKALESEPDPEYWKHLVTALAADPFYSGKNDRKWVATFDYMLQTDKHVELAERLVRKKSAESAAFKTMADLDAQLRGAS